jgi:plastocyanin
MSRRGTFAFRAFILSSAATLLLAGCGGSSSSPVGNSTPTPTPVPTPTPTPTPTPDATPTPAPTAVIIGISGERGNMSFSPATANVKVGQQVRWRNDDNIVHTATQTAGAFDTGFLSPGATSAPITMNTAGNINYACTVHPTMTGILTVTP